MTPSVITLPPGWRRTTNLDQGVVVAALAPRPGSHDIVPTLRLTVEPVTTPPEDWHDDWAAEAAARHEAHVLEDEDTIETGLHEARYRRFTHRRAGHDLVTEMWGWVVDGVGFLLSASIAREDYFAHFELFEAVADTFDPRGRGWPRSA